jgi:hypothetical protein
MNSLIAKVIVGGVVVVAGIVGVAQDLMVEKAPAISLTTQETDVPAGLQERMDAMVAAMNAGDGQAYAANYNMNYLYKMAQGQVEYDENLFGGTAEDAQRLQQNLSEVASPEAMAEMFAKSVNLSGIAKVSLESIEISEDGTHAKAKLVQTKDNNGTVISSPQWHYFDNGWWQIDD